MILRKPYAFFIKYFRLINLIMAILMAILIYRTGIIANFFNDYIEDYVTASNGFLVGNYINLYSFLLALLIIILTITVLSVLFVKEKPKKLYIFNLILFIVLVIVYGLDYAVLKSVTEAPLDIRVSKAFRDITFMVLGAQLLSLILTLIRATGFDIKSFNFAADLQKLDIDTKDNEEFEVAVEFDKNKMRRNIRKNIRNIYETYIEHKFLINLALIIIIVIIVVLIILNRGNYREDYNERESFNVSSIVMNIKNTYLTQNDQNGKLMTITNGKTNINTTLVVVKFDIKRITQDEDQTLNTGLMTLKIDKKSYGHTTKYNSGITDIGTPYTNQKLEEDFTSYILAFEIPTSEVTKQMILKINDTNSFVKGQLGAKSAYVNLKPQDLSQKQEVNEEKLKETLSFSGSILGNSELTIDEVQIEDKFKLSYDFCASKTNCYKSYEYLTPTATGNYFKTLMKISGQFENDTTENIDNIPDLYYLLKEFGTIHYQINDKWYSQKIDSELIKPTTAASDGYYIEVNRDIKNASSIYLTLNIRNYQYKYLLK